jgi:hypothetical protein
MEAVLPVKMCQYNIIVQPFHWLNMSRATIARIVSIETTHLDVFMIKCDVIFHKS